MAKEIKRLYRLDNRVIAGVCAGIAEYCDIDPVVVRILVVLLSVSTLGIVALIYILFWLVMPRRLNMTDSIVCDVHLRADSAGSPNKVSAGQAPFGAGDYKAVVHGDNIDTEARALFDSIGRPVRMFIWAGILLLFVGFTGLCSAVIEEVFWWQMWPCFVILGGVVIIALPSPHTASFMDRFFCGIVILAMGLFLLMITVHVLSWSTASVMLRHLWPILIMILGVGIISCALKSKPLAWAVALCFVAMLVVGVALYAVPGPLNQLTVHMPFVGVQVIDVNPWI